MPRPHGVVMETNMKITINLPDTLSAESRKVTVSAPTASIPVDIFARMIPHSFQQLLGDAASGAGKAAYEVAHPKVDYDSKNADHKAWVAANIPLVQAQVEPAMTKRLNSLLAGEWTARASGEGLSDIRSIAVHRLFKAWLAAKDAAAFGRFKKLSTSDQIRKALAKADSFADKIDGEVAKIEAERKARADADAERKAAIESVTDEIEIDF